MALAQPLPVPTDPAFDSSTPAGGYTWWYADGLSHDGEFGFTLIVFVGSVFSPYYAWAGRADPNDHCAVNLALYGRRAARWAMTERGRHDLEVLPDRIRIGPSRLIWDGAALIAEIDERAAPLPRRVRGRIRLQPRRLNTRVFQIDTAGAHLWQPIAPAADVEIDFEQPGLRWKGDGYWDMNRGPSPLESAFRYWDWSRVHAPDGTTAISYNTVERTGMQRSLSLTFCTDGRMETGEPAGETVFSPTPVFRLRRTTRMSSDNAPRLGRTLEDAPFYSRSVIEATIAGQRAIGMHESFDGDRLSMTIVKLMLPFRMPRRPIKP